MRNRPSGESAASPSPINSRVPGSPFPALFFPKPHFKCFQESTLPDHLPPLFDRSADTVNSPVDSSLQCLRHLGQTVNQGQGALRRRARPSSPFYLAVLSSDECAAPTLGAEPVLLNPNPDARPSPSRHSRSPRRPGRRQSHEPDRISDSECILQLAHIGRVRCGVEKPVSPLRGYPGATRSVCHCRTRD